MRKSSPIWAGRWPRSATPRLKRSTTFTRFDQVNQLVSASEAAPALGFMALCSLPRTNPGDYPQAADVTFKKAQRVRSNPSEKQKILPMEGEPLNPRDR